MGNITGAMVFQSCLPTVLGLLFTTWAFSAETRHQSSPRPVWPSWRRILIFGNMLRTGKPERVVRC